MEKASHPEVGESFYTSTSGETDVSCLERIYIVDKGAREGEAGARSRIGAESTRKNCLLLWAGCWQHSGMLMCKQEAEVSGVQLGLAICFK